MNNQILLSAASSGNIDSVRRLIAARAYVNYRDNQDRTPIFIASARGHIEIVQALIEAGADVNIPNNEGETPLSIANEFGHDDVVQVLIEVGARPPLRGRYPGYGFNSLNSTSGGKRSGKRYYTKKAKKTKIYRKKRTVKRARKY